MRSVIMLHRQIRHSELFLHERKAETLFGVSKNGGTIPALLESGNTSSGGAMLSQRLPFGVSLPARSLFTQ